MGKVRLDFVVNGDPYELDVEPWVTLLEVLRDRLSLKGTKEGCGQGDCGMCIALVDNRPVNSCLMLALDAAGSQVTTIEGLAGQEGLHPLQRSFIENGAFQCGFCTPAMILSSKALLDQNPDAGDEEITQALSGVLCRCGSYQKIRQAVLSAREGMGAE